MGGMGLFPQSRRCPAARCGTARCLSPNRPSKQRRQLMALARKMLGPPKGLNLIDGVGDIFGDKSIRFDCSTPKRTDRRSLLVHLGIQLHPAVRQDVIH